MRPKINRNKKILRVLDIIEELKEEAQSMTEYDSCLENSFEQNELELFGQSSIQN